MRRRELGRDSVAVLEARLRLVDTKRKFPQYAQDQAQTELDVKLLMEPERIPPQKRPRVSEPVGYVLACLLLSECGVSVREKQGLSNRIFLCCRILRIKKPRDPQEMPSPFPPEMTEVTINPHERANMVLRETDRYYESKKQTGWEDYIDVSSQSFTPTNQPCYITHALLNSCHPILRTPSSTKRYSAPSRTPDKGTSCA